MKRKSKINLLQALGGGCLLGGIVLSEEYKGPFVIVGFVLLCIAGYLVWRTDG